MSSAVIAWMAGMLYLPRLFVYHCETGPVRRNSERFKVMERRLLRIIINPAMIAAWILGLTLVGPAGDRAWTPALVPRQIRPGAAPERRARALRALGEAVRPRPEHHGRRNFIAIWNEVPTVLMIAIVILAVVKPF